ncbi:hypothetical protein ACE1TH_11930 [Shouchella sp. JSM 1781072]|uniref:hypothetical protein n=1 Tax=Bacillaceae TaxID=186817 RepID=UPI0020D01268|nr:hypothetical protein [Alkalihalobacillus sp. LMS6]UTR06962.1 hypothetical protein MM326_02715 [Alkalihalobacillus sp. LMS6]
MTMLFPLYVVMISVLNLFLHEFLKGKVEPYAIKFIGSCVSITAIPVIWTVVLNREEPIEIAFFYYLAIVVTIFIIVLWVVFFTLMMRERTPSDE